MLAPEEQNFDTRLDALGDTLMVQTIVRAEQIAERCNEMTGKELFMELVAVACMAALGVGSEALKDLNKEEE